MLAVFLGQRNASPPNDVLTLLEKVPAVDARELVDDHQRRRLALALVDILAVPRSGEKSATPRTAARVEWSETVFSALLSEAVKRHDYNRGVALLKALEDHLAGRGAPYPSRHARTDLKALRARRQFLLMRRYAEAVLKSGTGDAQVRRQYGQSLIELRDFDHAIKVLTAVVADTTPAKDDDSRNEQVEARGLLGRVRKQKYVDHGRRDGDELEAAIREYHSVFLEDSSNVWHGVNAATCIISAPSMTGSRGDRPTKGTRLRVRSSTCLQQREQAAAARNKRLDVWDYATRVEALIDLGRFDDGATALDDYLRHPGMNAFEVASTFRQFDEVMQLGKNPRGRPIVMRLSSAAERLRSGGIAPMSEAGACALLVHVADPSWTGAGIPDLSIQTRMGTVVAVTGSKRTVQALLKDPIVIAVEESRPAGEMECTITMPFIGVLDEYPSPAGNYAERGLGVLVAIVDDGIDVLHEAFRDEHGNSRIVGIWDQLDPAGPPPAGFDRRALLCGGGDRRIRARDDARARDTVASEHGPRHARRQHRGGTKDGQVRRRRRAGRAVARRHHRQQRADWVLLTHLAALDFIDREATRLDKPVVVNVSQGKNAGAHDGQSPLELAFDNFSFLNGSARPGRAVVKSAGNERDKRGHAQFTVPARSAETLEWRCPPGSPEVLIELWWQGGNEYSFTLESPDADVSATLDRNNPDVSGEFKGYGPYRLQLVPNHPQNGHNLVKITAVNGATARQPTDWILTVTAVDVLDNPSLHAWLERSGSPAVVEFTKHAGEGMTLSIPGTSRSVITVGAIGAKDPIMVGRFSSYGPTFDDRKKPDIAAPGVEVSAARRDSGNGVTRMSGTSMAAPHVTGAIALVFSKRLRTGQPLPTAMQLRNKLQHTTKYPVAQWDAGQGYGVLSVEKLLAAF